MHNLMEEYGKIVITAVVGIFIIGLLSGFLFNTWKSNGIYKDTGHLSGNQEFQAKSPLPTITLKSGNKTVKMKPGTTYNARNNVTVADRKDGTIASNKVNIKVEQVDRNGRTTISKLGTTGNTISVNANYRYYNIIYKVTNSRGYKAEKRMKLLVTGRTA